MTLSWRKATTRKRLNQRCQADRRRILALERLEGRTLMAADLLGIDLRPYGLSANYFNVTPQTLAWGDAATVSLYVANMGDTASGLFQSRVYLSKDATIDAVNDTFLQTINFPTLAAKSGSTFSYAGGAIPINLPASNPVGPSGPTTSA